MKVASPYLLVLLVVSCGQEKSEIPPPSNTSTEQSNLEEASIDPKLPQEVDGQVSKKEDAAPKEALQAQEEKETKDPPILSYRIPKKPIKITFSKANPPESNLKKLEAYPILQFNLPFEVSSNRFDIPISLERDPYRFDISISLKRAPYGIHPNFQTRQLFGEVVSAGTLSNRRAYFDYLKKLKKTVDDKSAIKIHSDFFKTLPRFKNLRSVSEHRLLFTLEKTLASNPATEGGEARLIATDLLEKIFLCVQNRCYNRALTLARIYKLKFPEIVPIPSKVMEEHLKVIQKEIKMASLGDIDKIILHCEAINKISTEAFSHFRKAVRDQRFSAAHELLARLYIDYPDSNGMLMTSPFLCNQLNDTHQAYLEIGYLLSVGKLEQAQQKSEIYKAVIADWNHEKLEKHIKDTKRLSLKYAKAASQASTDLPESERLNLKDTARLMWRNNPEL